MLELLISLLALVLSFGAINNPERSPEEIVTQIEVHLPDVNVDEDPNIPEIIPPQNQPDTQMVAAYNTQSGQPVGEVAAVAVENAQPLEPCETNPEVCEPVNSPDVPPPAPEPLPKPGLCPPGPLPLSGGVIPLGAMPCPLL